MLSVPVGLGLESITSLRLWGRHPLQETSLQVCKHSVFSRSHPGKDSAILVCKHAHPAVWRVAVDDRMLKGWCTWHKTWLQMMILGPLSRVMMVWKPFCAKNSQTSHFLCAKFSPARAVLYFQLNRVLLWSNRTAQRFNTTAGVQKLWHRTVL